MDKAQKEARTCATCGTKNNVANRTCVGCGAPLSGS
ncbi:hypothetical protein FBY39_1159 [Microbacterium sp. SLBN-146]|nr:hypothetical protein FBY39_1159 [Microbacterium sp. SLBN-146]